MSILEDAGVAAFLTAAVGIAGTCAFRLASLGLRRVEAEHRAHDRARRAEAAAIEAAFEEDWFSPDEIYRTVDEIIAVAGDVWRDGHPGQASRGDASYIARWARSIADDLGDGVRLVGEPAVDILGVTNRPGESEDRIVVRVRLRLHPPHPIYGTPHAVRADLRWTLGRRDQAWRLLSIDGDPLADPLLDRPLVPVEWADDERLREESFVELAEDDAGRFSDLSQLVVADMPVPRQLIELAQLDGRFDPDLLDARVRHVVEAWEEAATGASEPLAAVASPEALGLLLHPPSGGERGSTRLVLRDAEIEHWTATKLSIASVPYRIEIELVISAVGYLVSWPQGTYLAGDPEEPHELDLSWTLALSPTAPTAWRLISSTNPADGIRGGGA